MNERIITKTTINGARAQMIFEDMDYTPYQTCPICFEELLVTDIAVALKPDKEEVPLLKQFVEMEQVIEKCKAFTGKTSWRHYVMPEDVNKDTGEIIDPINIIMFIDFSDIDKMVDKSSWVDVLP